jgi:LEA14-like dessication related protein
MRVKTVIISTAALSLVAAGYYFYRQFKIASEIDYDFKNFKIEGASANQAVLSCDIVIQNKTGLSLKVYGIFCELFINDYKIGQVNNETLTLLPANTTSSIPIRVNINLSQLGTSITQIVSNINTFRNSTFFIKGRMDVGKGIIRVRNYKFDYDENLTSLILQSV